MPLRMTIQTLQVVSAFLEDVTHEWHGFGLVDRTGIKSGTLYPILIRLEKAGWLDSRLEDIDPSAAGRPPRRLYVLSAEGEAAARVELAAHLDALAPARASAPKFRERLA